VPPLRVRVGVATGELLVGLIGSSNKFDYTVLGDTANLGARLEGLNKLYGTSVLVTARTAREAGGAVVARRIDAVRVVGRLEPVELYEVLGEAGEADGVLPLRCEGYAEAAARYARRDWAGAAERFARVCREWPDDGAARAMAERCKWFGANEPAGDWDGVWVATSK
jgi:adenylate cyclase